MPWPLKALSKSAKRLSAESLSVWVDVNVPNFLNVICDEVVRTTPPNESEAAIRATAAVNINPFLITTS